MPLFVEELARGLTDGSEIAASAMPTTLSEVITARLDRVGTAKRVAQAAAVIGRSFDLPVLQAATGLQGDALDAELNRLTEHAIVEPGTRPGELQFRHALFHEVSYRSVLRPDRVRVHGAVGEMLVASGRADAQPEIAAYHLGAAGRAAEAVPLWKQASRTARHNARFREAAAHEREVLALVPQLPEEERTRPSSGRSRLVLCLTAVDQSAPEALEESRRVEVLARRLGDHEMLLRNYLVLIPWWQASAEYATINRILADARSEAEALGDEWTLRLITTYEATTRIWQGMLRSGLSQLRESYESSGLPLDASLSDLPPMQSVELMALAAPRIASALACWLCGHATEAWRIADDVLRCTTERQVPQAQAVAAVTSAIMAQLDGEREVVVKLAGEALHVADEVEHAPVAAVGPVAAVVGRRGHRGARAAWSAPPPLLRIAPGRRPARHRRTCLWLCSPTRSKTSRATGERFCEAEILRVRAGRLLRVRTAGIGGGRLRGSGRPWRECKEPRCSNCGR